MATQVGEMSPGEVRWPYREKRCGEMALQVGEMSPGGVRWPYR